MRNSTYQIYTGILPGYLLGLQMNKLYLSITSLLFLLVGTANADSAITSIREEYKLIRDELNILEKTTKPLNNYSAEGGSVHAFRNKNNKIKLIKVELYGESGKVFEEYYYKNHKLIFSFHEQHKYNVPFTVTDEIAKEMGVEPFNPKKTKINENRYYFNEGKLIRWLNEFKKDIPSKSKDFIEAQDNVYKFSNEMLGKFKSKT